MKEKYIILCCFFVTVGWVQTACPFTNDFLINEVLPDGQAPDNKNVPWIKEDGTWDLSLAPSVAPGTPNIKPGQFKSRYDAPWTFGEYLVGHPAPEKYINQFSAQDVAELVSGSKTVDDLIAERRQAEFKSIMITLLIIFGIGGFVAYLIKSSKSKEVKNETDK